MMLVRRVALWTCLAGACLSILRRIEAFGHCYVMNLDSRMYSAPYVSIYNFCLVWFGLDSAFSWFDRSRLSWRSDANWEQTYMSYHTSFDELSQLVVDILVLFGYPIYPVVILSFIIVMHLMLVKC